MSFTPGAPCGASTHPSTPLRAVVFHALRSLARAPSAPSPPVGGFELTEQQTESVGRVITALATQRGIILAGGMGSGKTVQALNVAYALAGVGGRVLFIVPAGLVGMWCKTARRFCGDVDIRAIKGGGGADSIASFMTGTHWLDVSYEYYAGHSGAFPRHDARVALLVCDEAHMLGGSRRQRYSSVRLCPADKVLLLSPTPCTNSLLSLWPLLNLCTPGGAGEERYWSAKVVEPIELGEDSVRLRLARGFLDPLIAKYVLRPAALSNGLPPCPTPTSCSARRELQRSLGSAITERLKGLPRAQAQVLLATHPALLGSQSKPSAAARAAGLVDDPPDSWSDTLALAL